MKASLLPMEASTRRLLLSSFLRNPNPRNGFRSINLSSSRHFSNPNKSFLSVSSLSVSSSPDRRGHGGGGDLGFCSEKGESTSTVVLLGWLGAEEKHLKRYAELYSSRGFRPVRFVVPVRETIGPDLCRGVEDRVEALAKEIEAWCAENEDRHLIFHTFSNTGWLTYGALLQNFQSRTDIIKKIKGCVIDSAPSTDISPQVWAAGYCAALLKKRSTSFTETTEGGKLNGRGNKLNVQDVIPALIEMLAMEFFKLVFSVVLLLPYANRRLSSVISTLKNQPSCPQLYLYSSADKVIPAHAVQCFILDQKVQGKHVYSHDFGISPHVDHFRTFPDVYSTKVNEFLDFCCMSVVHKR